MEANKMHIYQLFVRLFGNKVQENKPNGTLQENGCGKFNDINDAALKSLQKLGMTHVWYTGVIEHAMQTAYPEHNIEGSPAVVTKGIAGSPYAIRDYYDVNPDLAIDVDERMKEFESLVTRTHKNGLKAIIDFVPNHVSRTYASDKCPEGEADFGETDEKGHAFNPQNNFYYVLNESFRSPVGEGFAEYPAKATGNDVFSAYPSINDWYETIKLNYGVDYMAGGWHNFDPIPNTWHKMLNILLFWAEKGVDGFRCDMAEMVPVDFWHWCIAKVKEQFPSIIFIAEVYNPAEYRNYIQFGGFDYLYDKVGMYDTVRNVMCNRGSAVEISSRWQEVNDILPHMLNFLENHDEQRVASDFFAGNAEVGIPATALMAALSKSPYMLYMGQEFGEKGMDEEGFSGRDGRTTIFDYWALESMQPWFKEGKFIEKSIPSQAKQLRNKYKRLFNYILKEPTLCCGDLYDIQYANIDNADYDEHNVFSFIKHKDNELVLVVVNLSNEEKSVCVNIPEHAEDFIGFDKEKTHCVEVFNTMRSEAASVKMTDWLKENIKIPAYASLFFKFKY